MAKKVVENLVDYKSTDINLDDNAMELEVIPQEIPQQEIDDTPIMEQKTVIKENGLINCLRNERIIVRHIPKEGGMISNPKHILYGGMSESAVRTFVVPRMSSGMFVNILTDTEKAYLENIMGLEYNSLSIYKKKDNFWDDSNDVGISTVRLKKQDNFLNLSDPEDYIRYKILLANKDFIAPSLKVLEDSPKATYQFVLIVEGEESKSTKDKLNIKMKCYKEYGKVEDNIDILRTIIEIIDSRPTSPTVKLEFLQGRIDNLITADSKLFYNVITDKLLPTKVLIKKAIEAGLISNRGNMLYLRSDGTPLCEHNEEPTMNIAAKYLNSPRRQDIKFSLEAKLKA